MRINTRLLTIELAAIVMIVMGCGAPSSISHMKVTEDGSHMAQQISMSTGVPNAPRQTVMIVYNQWSKEPVSVVSANTKPFSDKLVDDFIDAIKTFGAAVIQGNFVLMAAKAGACNSEEFCGTLVQVANNAASTAAADASAQQDGVN